MKCQFAFKVVNITNKLDFNKNFDANDFDFLNLYPHQNNVFYTLNVCNPTFATLI
jgi:hypothetical protein